ncbi:PfkB family carbohydrate kinase [Saccharococcus sp. Marseille-Q5394]|uniref:PfkB family carbohydrate kinase n=1 Tax=Saccharococcus sp. Marseille-Q5394 TaxID=2972778 RepID=UPI0021C81F65|nr:PfkB family carbohydrate kinase [Saccharococcus sp. Marseille-Q5394]
MIVSKKKHVWIYGDVFVDYLVRDYLNTTFNTFLGVTTVNVAAGVSRLGAPSAFITVIGDDATSQFVWNELRQESIDLSFAKPKTVPGSGTILNSMRTWYPKWFEMKFLTGD